LHARRRAGHARTEGTTPEAVARGGHDADARRRADHGHADESSGQRRPDRRLEGRHGRRVVCGSAVRHRGHLQGLRGELPGGNPLLISPDWLIEDELARPADCAGATFSPTTVDFDAVTRFKYPLLETAWKNFRAGARPDLRRELEHFVEEHAHWLDDYALFRA